MCLWCQGPILYHTQVYHSFTNTNSWAEDRFLGIMSQVTINANFSVTFRGSFSAFMAKSFAKITELNIS